jgi:hypothetical protein
MTDTKQSRAEGRSIAGVNLHSRTVCALAAIFMSVSVAADGQPRKKDIPEIELTPLEEAIDDATNPFPDLELEEPRQMAPGEDECDWDLEEQPIQEQSQEVLRSWSCHTFRWFDGWWGEEIDYPENEVSGWITLGTEWRKYDGLDPRMRFRVRAPLPNMNQRWDVLFGRVDEEAFVSDTEAQDETFYNPGAVGRSLDEDWVLGLGKKRRNKRKGWDWSMGVRLRWPPEPYVKLSYFYNTQPSEDTDLRLRQTFFWRSERGFGTTSRGDFSWGINTTNVMRWEGSGTVNEETEGVRWFAGQTWYHLLKDRTAFSLLAFARGETDYEVGVKDAGFNFIYRRPFTRDWMYLSFGPNITWPREKAEDKRELNLGFGVWLEMEFGEWRF